MGLFSTVEIPLCILLLMVAPVVIIIWIVDNKLDTKEESQKKIITLLDDLTKANKNIAFLCDLLDEKERLIQIQKENFQYWWKFIKEYSNKE